jgi:hypothetical protein
MEEFIKGFEFGLGFMVGLIIFFTITFIFVFVLDYWGQIQDRKMEEKRKQ